MPCFRWKLWEGRCSADTPCGGEVQAGAEAALRQAGGGSSGLPCCPHWAPPGGVLIVSQPRPNPGADLCAGSPCSQQSCPARQSHGNSCCSCPVPYSSPPAWPAPPCAPPPHAGLHQRSGSHDQEDSHRNQTPPKPPHKWLISLHLSLSMVRVPSGAPGGSPKVCSRQVGDSWGLWKDIRQMVQDCPKVHSSLCHGTHLLCRERDSFPSFPVLPCVPYYTHTSSHTQ